MIEVIPEIAIFDRLPLAITSLAAVSIAGLAAAPLRGYAGPPVWLLVDSTLGILGRRLDRRQRSGKELFLRGLAFAALALFFGLGMGSLALHIVWKFPHYDLLEILFLSLCLSSGSIWRAAWQLYEALKKNKRKSGVYYTIARSSGLDLSASDDFGLTRVAIGYAVRMLPMALVAPVFWYLIGGLPLAFAYAAIAASAWHLGREGYGKAFGKPVLLLEAATGFIANILSAVLLTLASAFSPTVSVFKTFKGWFAKENAAPYAEGGKNLTCAAWGLDISLGGPVTGMDGFARKKAWIGPEGASARLDASHVKRSLYLLIISATLLLAALILMIS